MGARNVGVRCVLGLLAVGALQQVAGAATNPGVVGDPNLSVVYDSISGRMFVEDQPRTSPSAARFELTSGGGFLLPANPVNVPAGASPLSNSNTLKGWHATTNVYGNGWEVGAGGAPVMAAGMSFVQLLADLTIEYTRNPIFIGNQAGDLVYFDNQGASQGSPVVPLVQNADGSWSFFNVPGMGRWFDPQPSSAFDFTTLDSSLFTVVGLPTGLGDADGMYTITDATNGSVTLAAGSQHTFPTPVDAFTISGINPTVDGDDPQAFPAYLEFNQPVVSFNMNPVPEPTAMLAIAGVSLLGLRARRVRRGTAG